MKNISITRLLIGLYIAGAIVSFGPIAVAMRDNTPPGPNLSMRQDLGMFLGLFVAPAWPLFWSYQAAK